MEDSEVAFRRNSKHRMKNIQDKIGFLIGKLHSKGTKEISEYNFNCTVFKTFRN